MKKIVFIGFPILSGNYTHFRYLKNGLNEMKVTLISLGATSLKALPENNFVHLGKELDRKKDSKKLAKLFLDYVSNENINIIIPTNSPIVISVIPFLPPTCKVVQSVNSDTPRVYKYVTSHLEYVSKIACTSKKQLNEIEKVTSTNFFLKNVCLIPQAVSLVNDEVIINLKDKLRIGFIGRMHQGHKNIFLIPEILKRLKCPFQLELIGNGEDKNELITKLKKYNIEYNYIGEIDNKDIHSYLQKWDIKLFPSFVEGFGITLIECMNNGVVPLANELKGITDYIITNQKDGFVIPNNNIDRYVQIIEKLNSDRNLLNKMKKQAKKTVKERFALELIIQQYQELFQEVFKTPKLKNPENFSDWKEYREYKPRLEERILNRLKRFL